MKPRLHATISIVLALVCPSLRANVSIVRQSQEQRGLAWTVMTPDVPLAFTGQIAGWDEAGRISGNAAVQTRRAITNVQALLRAHGSNLERVVKLDVYLTDDTHHTAALQIISEAFANHAVPVAFVRTRLAPAEALVAVEAVAQAGPDVRALRVASLASLPAPACGAHIGLLPAGRRVFLSGYASRTKAGLRESLREVLASQRKTLDHHGLGPADVAQVKGWLSPLADTAALRDTLEEFFGDRPVPPMVLIEWPASGACEIEFVLAGAKAKPHRFVGPLAFGTRPGVPAPTRFSHVAFIEAGQPLIFTAGLYGRPGNPTREQLQEIYAQLGRILFDAGSGFRYLAKATYHNIDVEGRRVLGEIRDVYYDPARPPAASGVIVDGVGRPECTATLSVIAVPLPKP